MSIARPVKKTFAARTRAGKTPLQRKIALLRAGKENGGAQKAAAQHKAFGVPQRLAILPAASIAFRLRVCYNNLYIVKKQGEPEMEEQKKRILADKAYLDGVLTEGARRAAAIADRTVTKVYKKVGFLQI